MTENMKRFVEAAEKDAALAEAMGKVEKPEDLLALAAEKGLTLTAEDIKPAEATGELSDEELEDVAGGSFLLTPMSKLLRRFNLWMPAANGLRFSKDSAPTAGHTMYFNTGSPATANKTVYFGGTTGGPIRLGNADGGTVAKEV